MANEIFDRETLLDLTVNVIPLFIIGFFVVTFAVSSPFGIDPLASSIQFGLLAIPFVLLAILTYFAGKAVAGSERSGPVYLPGQAGVRGAKPLEHDGEADDETTAAIESDDETPAVTGESDAATVEGDDGDTADDTTADDIESTDDATAGDTEPTDDEAAEDDTETKA